MAGLRINWINDSNGGHAPGLIAKKAYRRIAEYAFGLSETGQNDQQNRNKWINFLSEKPRRRLLYLARQLTADVGTFGSGVMGPRSRVLITYDDKGPANLNPGNGGAPFGDAIRDYYLAHELRFVDDGENYTNIVFDGLPLALDYNAYLHEHAGDEDENAPGEPARKRALRIFAMTLFTRCR